MNDPGTDLPGLFTDHTTVYQEYNPSVFVTEHSALGTQVSHLCEVSCQYYDILLSCLGLKCIGAN
jgi:hypothetical protein